MKLIRFDTLGSTNTEALQRLPEWESMSVLWALEQTAGRGQRGNTWFAAPGENLTFSIVLKENIPAADAAWLNYAISEAVAQFLGQKGVNCKVKWPNDIYVGGRKICGILIENTLQGDVLAASVIGVGLNINQTEFPQLALATSLKKCTGQDYDLEECLRELIGIFEGFVPALKDEEKRADLFRAYDAHLFQKGSVATYRDMASEARFQGIILGVDPADGRLRIHDVDAGEDRLYRFKEVSYIL